MLLHGQAKPAAWYRILYIAGFGKSLEPKGTLPYRAELEPVFSFEWFHSGFTFKEIERLRQPEAEPTNWKYVLKKKIKSFFSNSGQSNWRPIDWFFKLDRIYDNIFSVNWNNAYAPAPFEGNRSLPYFGYHEFQYWPWNQHFFIFPENKWQFQPVYLGNSVAGYRVLDRKLFSETEGFLVMPGKFFLPNRLKIRSVNGIPWENYQPPILTRIPEILPPEFPGGPQAQRAFLNKILKGSDFSIGGYTTLAFDIDANGKATYMPQENPVYSAADSVGAIIARQRPHWEAGSQNGLPVFSRIRIPFPVVLYPNQRDYTDIIRRVTRRAEFPGDPYALENYIQKNIRYPASARRQKIEGLVVVKATISKDGSVEKTEIIKGLTNDLDDEAVRVVKNMPKWYPGKQDGMAVQSEFRVPVIFRLDATAANK